MHSRLQHNLCLHNFSICTRSCLALPYRCLLLCVSFTLRSFLAANAFLLFPAMSRCPDLSHSIHNTIADAISWLEYDPSINQTAENYHMTKVKKRSSKCSHRQSWMTVSNHWCNLEIDTDKHKDLNFALLITEKRMKYTLSLP
jgi:hypothetical protein